MSASEQLSPLVIDMRAREFQTPEPIPDGDNNSLPTPQHQPEHQARQPQQLGTGTMKKPTRVNKFKFPEYNGRTFEDHQIYDYLQQVWDQHHQTWDTAMCRTFLSLVPKARFSPTTRIFSAHCITKQVARNGPTLAHFIVLNAIFGKKPCKARRWWRAFEGAHPTADDDWEGGPFYGLGAGGIGRIDSAAATPEPDGTRASSPSPSPSLSTTIGTTQSQQRERTTESDQRGSGTVDGAEGLMAKMEEVVALQQRAREELEQKLEKLAAEQQQRGKQFEELAARREKEELQMRERFDRWDGVLEEMFGHMRRPGGGRAGEFGAALNIIGTQLSWNMNK